MLSENRFAFKEWAVICGALRRGRQSLILRKGGIHEGREGFRVEHREFWLYPTRFHQRPEELVADGRLLIPEALAQAPPAGSVILRDYAVVEDVLRIDAETSLPALEGLHLWSEQTVLERFHYRQPGLFVLAVRIFSLPQPLSMAESPHFAGCRSWVDFPQALPTAGLQPVLSDAALADRLAQIRRAIGANSQREVDDHREMV